LEHHLLFVDDVVTFQFFAEIPRVLVWQERSKIEQFCISVDNFVKMPIAFAQTLPEFNNILRMTVEELPEIS